MTTIYGYECYEPTKPLSMIADLVAYQLKRAGVLADNFPDTVKVYSVGIFEDVAAFGGHYMTETGLVPFIALNLALHQTTADVISSVAHELIHVDQFDQCSHNNSFRKKCSKAAKILGVCYYAIMGYDRPSSQTARAMAKKYESRLLAYGAPADFAALLN